MPWLAESVWKGCGNARNAPVSDRPSGTGGVAGRFPDAGWYFRPAHPAGPRRWQAPQGQDRQKQGLQDQERQGARLRDHAPQGEIVPGPNAAGGHADRPAASGESGCGEPAPFPRSPAGDSGAFSVSIKATCDLFLGARPRGDIHKAEEAASADGNTRPADGPSACRTERATPRAGAIASPACPLRLPPAGPAVPAENGGATLPAGGAAGIAAIAGHDSRRSGAFPPGHPETRREAGAPSAGGGGRPSRSGDPPIFHHDTRGHCQAACAARFCSQAVNPGGSARAGRTASLLFLRSAADDVGTSHRPSSTRPAAAPCGPCPAAA